jgi:hypothetical protein
MDFTIGLHRGEGHWEELEAVTAKDPAAALSRWVDAQGGTEAGEYGVRASDRDAWEWLFRADSKGLHPVDVI